MLVRFGYLSYANFLTSPLQNSVFALHASRGFGVLSALLVFTSWACRKQGGKVEKVKEDRVRGRGSENTCLCLRKQLAVPGAFKALAILRTALVV